MDFLYKTNDEAIKEGLLSGNLNGVRYERVDKSESYVTIPPAYLIMDKDGAVWGFGNEYANGYDGELEFNVLRNDVDVDEVAKRIEYRRGRVYIYGSGYGWKHWSYHGKCFI